MNSNHKTDADPLEDQLISLLVEYEERLLAGSNDVTGSADGAPDQLRPRLDRAQSMLRRLAQVAEDDSTGNSVRRSTDAAAQRNVPLVPSERQQIGRFEIRGELGHGGFGVVFLAYDPNLRRQVALKIPRFGSFATPQIRARLLREAWAAAGLDHTNIVPVYEAGEEDGVCYIASAYCRGTTLAEWLMARHEPVPAKDVAKLIADLSGAVQHAHSRGVLHRDLKPSNVLLEQGPGNEPAADPRYKDDGSEVGEPVSGCALDAVCPRVTDFGLAKIQTEQTEETQSGMLIGTVQYMAPEQAQGQKHVGPAADIYALGVILYELVTGRPPFQGETQLDTLHDVQHMEPVPPRRLRAKLPHDMETICLKCLEKEPQSRYRTAEEVGNELRRFLRGEPIKARRIHAAARTWRWCKRNPSIATMSASVITLLIVIAIGSTIASLRLQQQQQVTQRYLGQFKQKLWDSLVIRARAGRRSGMTGQRFESLDALAEARELAPDLELRPADIIEMRNEAIACVVLPDIRLERQWKVPRRTGAEHVVAFDANLQQYACVEPNGSVVVRRLADNQQVASLPQRERCRSLRFSPDGRLLAVQGYDRDAGNWRLSLWSLSERKMIMEAPAGGMQRDKGLDFSRRGQLMAVNGPDGTICLYSVPSGARQKTLAAGDAAACIRFHPQVNQLAVCRGSLVEVLDADRGQIIRTFEHPNQVTVQDAAWSPDGELLAVGTSTHVVYVWGAHNSKAPRSILKGHQAWVTQVAFSPDGQVLASASSDGTTRFWDPRTSKQMLTIEGYAVRFSRDGPQLGMADGSFIGRWTLATGREFRTLYSRENSRISNSISISPDGRLVASSSFEGVSLWDFLSGKQIASLPIGFVCKTVFDENGTSLITSETAGLRRWPIRRSAAGELQIGPPWPVHGFDEQTRSNVNRPIVLFDFYSGRSCLFPGTSNGKDRIVDPREADLTTISPDGKWGATATHAGHGVKVWSIASGKLRRHLLSGIQETAAAFSPDGQWLVIGTKTEYSFWRVGSWKLSHRLARKSITQDLIPIAFSPDGQIVALNLALYKVALVETSSGRQFASLPASDWAPWLCFGTNGDSLICTGENDSIQVWDLRRIRQQLVEIGLDWDCHLTRRSATVTTTNH